MNRLTLTILTAALAATTFADVVIHRGGCGFRGNDIIRTSYRHVPLSDPGEPYHDTYRKNIGEVCRKAPKPVANAHAKASAAQADALRQAARAEQAQRPTISVYSNVTARQDEPRRGDGGGRGNDARTINISNSNVVINN